MNIECIMNNHSGLGHLKTRNEDISLAYYSMFFWYSSIIVDVFRKLNLIFLGGMDSLTVLFRNIIYILLFVGVLQHAIKNRRVVSLLYVVCIFFLFFGFSLLYYPPLHYLAKETILLFFSRCLIAMYLAFETHDWRKTIDKLVAFSWIPLSYCFLILISGVDLFTNYMSLSYALVIPAFIMSFGVERPSLYSIISSLIMLTTIFIFGARGPLICFSCAAFAMIYMSLQTTISKKRLVLVSSCVFCIMLTVIYFNDIIRFFYNIWPDSRTISSLVYGRFTYDSGRSNYYNYVLREISEHPFLFRGLLSDRVYLSNYFGISIAEGPYPHNFFLELLFQFGVPIGGLLSIAIISKITKLLTYAKKHSLLPLKIAIAIFIISPLTSLMISGSYVLSPSFWFGLGLVINTLRLSKIGVHQKNQ